MTSKSKTQLPLFPTSEPSRLAPARAIKEGRAPAGVYQNDTTPAGVEPRAGDLFELEDLLDPIDLLMIDLEGGVEALEPGELQEFIDDRRREREREARAAEEKARKAAEAERVALREAHREALRREYGDFIRQAMTEHPGYNLR